MICPHCRRNVLRKERTGGTCGKCRRGFAFDPKDNPLRLHDLRMHRQVERLGEGRYHYTATQLWYALGRKRLTVRTGRQLYVAAVLLCVGAIWVGVEVSERAGPFVGVPLAAVPVALAVAVLAYRHSAAFHPSQEMAMPRSDFDTAVLRRWEQTYRTPLPGLVDEARAGSAGYPADAGPPVLAVLCPDRTVLACLAANGVPARLRVALATLVVEVPPDVPVALLHDASVAGHLFAAQARWALRDRRVTDLGLRPAAVLKAPHALTLRDRPPPPEHTDWLRTTGGLPDAEAAWLAQGWWSPVAAVRPRVLIAKVAAVAARAAAGTGPDPDRRAAAGTGFLTWPGGAP